MYGGDLGLEGIIHQSMSGKECLLLELGRYDDGVEGLTATSRHVFY